jgi:predicted porin
MGIATNYTNVTIGSLEDLGGGLKLDFAFQIDAGNINTGGGAVNNRNSHIGLVSDSWGGVWVGSNEMLYESYYYTVDPLDGAAGLAGNLSMLGTPGFGNVFDNPGSRGPAGCTSANGGSGCAGFYRRDSNAIWYNSPNFNGFTGGVYMTLPDSYATQASAATGVNGINPYLWGLGVKYVGPSMPIQAWFAYEQHHDMFGLGAINPSFGTPGGTGGANSMSSKDYGIQLGVGYTFGDIFAYVNFEELKYQTDLNPLTTGGGTAEYKRNAFSIGAKWTVATGYVGAQLIDSLSGSCSLPTGGCDAGETSGWMVGLGYYHTMSKQTQAFVMANYIKPGKLNTFTNGGGVGDPYNLGATMWGLEVGLKHSF